MDRYKWDMRFMQLAKHISSWSKDPSTKCGAVIANKKRLVSFGFNGFASGVDDDNDKYKDRDFKLAIVVHAEVNAVLFAKGMTEGCTLYTYPFTCCSNCAAIMIQAGIKRCVSIVESEDVLSRWSISLNHTKNMFKEANIDLTLYDSIEYDL